MEQNFATILTPVRYALPWSRMQFPSIPGMTAAIEATYFDEKTGVPTKWAVRDNGLVLAKVVGRSNLGFIYEPMPSSRTKRFLSLTRFDSLEEAVKAAVDHFRKDNPSAEEYWKVSFGL